MFFEDKKTITVNGVSFNMILVEGDKFIMDYQTPIYGTIHHRCKREVELDDFYIAEIPVTQELYAAVMRRGYGNTKSYNMMPDSFDYLHPNYGLPSPDFWILGVESNEEYHKRRKREYEEKNERETKEYNRIRALTSSLPVNHISWLECIEFINTLNTLTGLNFALPSFEQWYFAASGGIESKGYKFAGSDDANAVGHFHKLSKKEFRPGVYVMTGERDKSKVREPATKWYEKPKQYQPNELGLYDMSGLVYEWLDKAGYVIGGSFHSNPDQVSKSYGFGYTRYSSINSCLNEERIFVRLTSRSYDDNINSGNLFGLRLVLLDRPKSYEIPTPQYSEFKTNVRDTEKQIIDFVSQIPDLGLLRRVIANRFEAGNRLGSISVYKDFEGNVYDVFVCPQNLTSFNADCFNNYHSRRKFVNHCVDEFKKVIKALCKDGYNLLIVDELGVDLSDLGINPLSVPDLSPYNFKGSYWRLIEEFFRERPYFTNNQKIIEAKTRILPSTRTNYTPISIDTLRIADNLILIDIRLSHDVRKSTKVDSEWITNSIKLSNSEIATRITFNCFCDFHSEENDCEKNYSVDGFRTEGIVRFMRKKLLNNASRINLQYFNTTELINHFFCKRSFGGEYAYIFPKSEGSFVVQDESFFILPEVVYNEWKATLHQIND